MISMNSVISKELNIMTPDCVLDKTFIDRITKVNGCDICLADSILKCDICRAPLCAEHHIDGKCLTCEIGS